MHTTLCYSVTVNYWLCYLQNSALKNRIIGSAFHSRYEICTREVRLDEFGVYNLRLKDSACHLETALEPVNANLALLFW